MDTYEQTLTLGCQKITNNSQPNFVPQMKKKLQGVLRKRILKS